MYSIVTFVPDPNEKKTNTILNFLFFLLRTLIKTYCTLVFFFKYMYSMYLKHGTIVSPTFMSFVLGFHDISLGIQHYVREVTTL